MHFWRLESMNRLSVDHSWLRQRGRLGRDLDMPVAMSDASSTSLCTLLSGMMIFRSCSFMIVYCFMSNCLDAQHWAGISLPLITLRRRLTLDQA